jgi:hypothetical protein
MRTLRAFEDTSPNEPVPQASAWDAQQKGNTRAGGDLSPIELSVGVHARYESRVHQGPFPFTLTD